MVDEAERRWVGSMPQAYERLLAPAVFRPFAVELAQRVAALKPDRVLEVAAGTGVLTTELLSAVDGEITATDLNEAMVGFGREAAPGATWRQADALALPFEDGTFDVVTGQFGVMFFPDKPAGFAEAGRVLRPGGSVLLTTWGPVMEHDFGVAVTGALERIFPGDVPQFLVSIPHGYFDPDVITSDVRAGGLECRGIHRVTLEGQASSAADLATGFCTGTPLRGEIEARGDLDSVTAVMVAEMESQLGTGPVTGRMTAYVIEAGLPER